MNVVVPFLLALSRGGDQARVEQRLHNVYSSLRPLSDNSITRYMKTRIFQDERYRRRGRPLHAAAAGPDADFPRLLRERRHDLRVVRLPLGCGGMGRVNAPDPVRGPAAARSRGQRAVAR